MALRTPSLSAAFASSCSAAAAEGMAACKRYVALSHCPHATAVARDNATPLTRSPLVPLAAQRYSCRGAQLELVKPGWPCRPTQRKENKAAAAAVRVRCTHSAAAIPCEHSTSTAERPRFADCDLLSASRLHYGGVFVCLFVRLFVCFVGCFVVRCASA